MLPKEHGAYGQLAAPLATALTVSGLSTAAVALAAAVALTFVAHEPLVVLRGGRGARARRERAADAARWLIVTTSGAVAAAVIAVWQMPPAVRWSLLLPAVPACVVAIAVARDRDKSAAAEVGMALAFALTAVPVCLAGGAPREVGATIALPYAVVFVAATLAVRAVTLTARGAGARAIQQSRAGALLVATAGSTALVWAGEAGSLPWAALAAALPGAVLASGLALAPPPARRLRTVGWMLMAVTATALIVLVSWSAFLR